MANSQQDRSDSREEISLLLSSSVKQLSTNFSPNSVSKNCIKYDINSLPDVVIEEKSPSVKISAPSKSSKSLPPPVTNWTIEDKKYQADIKQILVVLEPEVTDENVICGRSGSIRGVKNKVTAALATFQQTTTQKKTQEYISSERGDVVVYTTTNGIVRNTFQQCLRVKAILSTLQVPFQEKDIFIRNNYSKELKQRLDITKHNFYDNASVIWEDIGVDEAVENVNGDSDGILVPQVFIEGRHIGGAARLEALNECGELKEILKAYMSPTANQVCSSCGNYRFLICQLCKGSKTSPRRNNFSPNNWFARKVYLKCTNCDENGLVKCTACKR